MGAPNARTRAPPLAHVTSRSRHARPLQIIAEKQLKRRIGAAAPMRDGGHEADNYAGEATGIRKAISKSRIIKH